MPSHREIGLLKDLLLHYDVIDTDLFEQEYEAGLYSIDQVNKEWIEQQKEKYPHRFKGHTTADESLLRRAFIDGNLTAQGKVVEQCGGDVARANEIAARFGGKIRRTTPGIDPAAEKTRRASGILGVRTTKAKTLSLSACELSKSWARKPPRAWPQAVMSI